MIIFELKTEYIELYKLLKITGLCESGAEAKHVVSSGLVKVDNHKETRKGNKIKPGQKIDFNGMSIEVRAPKPGEPPKNCC